MTESFSKNVFINCPYDTEYIPLLRPLLFTILFLGYDPRIASESFDSGEVRFNRICSLIKQSKFSIHDLSRIQAEREQEFYRMNMPFELGLDIGCRTFKDDSLANQKKCLILEKEKYRYQKALSDLAGADIKSHNNEPEEVVRQIRNWFIESDLDHAVSPSRIWETFNEFMADFYVRREEEGFKGKDLEMMPIPEYIRFISHWLHDGTSP